MKQLNQIVQIANKEDIYKIYEFAQGRYKASRINGPEIKLPWWEQNPQIFYVIHDNNKKVIANINLLPLKQNCYNRICQGIINERGIRPEDLFTLEERDLVNHIYVEGFNCKNSYLAYVLLTQLESFIENISNTGKTELLIGAIGGTKAGERIMNNLGFKMVSNNHGLLDKSFLEINWKLLSNNIKKRVENK